MIAGRMRAKQEAPVLRSSNSSKRRNRTARVNGTTLGSQPTPGEWDGASERLCRDSLGAGWAGVPCFDARPCDVPEPGLLGEVASPLAHCSAWGPRRARKPCGFKRHALGRRVDHVSSPSAAWLPCSLDPEARVERIVSTPADSAILSLRRSSEL